MQAFSNVRPSDFARPIGDEDHSVLVLRLVSYASNKRGGAMSETSSIIGLVLLGLTWWALRGMDRKSDNRPPR